jgi:hypothetical protein
MHAFYIDYLLVTVRIYDGDKNNFVVVDEARYFGIAAILCDELVEDVRESGTAQPFPCMN